MATDTPLTLLRLRYDKAAEAYLRSLPLEHFMEATAQATQRKITLESLDLLSARRPDVQVFNELLVQYSLEEGKIGQVVPDNMVVIHNQPIKALTSYSLPLQPVGPFWVLEYVSKASERKDYDVSFQKYEQHLKVPYYLLFYPDEQELTLFRHTGQKYVSVRATAHGRYALPELDLEIGLLGGWARYWHRGELLPLPADLERQLDAALTKVEELRNQVKEEQRRADEQARRAEEERQARLAMADELARLRAELERRGPAE
jgi:Uma2 family endonuclease